jgi:hypothetical protein
MRFYLKTGQLLAATAMARRLGESTTDLWRAAAPKVRTP